jgi:hypothetical protein
MPSTAHQTENVGFIKEQFSTVVSHRLKVLNLELHFPELHVAHYIPCLGWPFARSFALESSAKSPKERTAESSFYLPPASRSPQTTYR